MKIAVIGANGFLGSSLIDFFINQNVIVTAFSRKPIKQNCNWIEFNSDLKMNFEVFNNYTHIFYCSASGVQSKNEINNNDILLVNALFPIKLSQFLKDTEIKLITFGTYFEIGNNNIDKEWNEEEIVFSRNHIELEYIKTKKLLSYWAHISNSFIHFILPTIYGENEDKNRLIPYLIDKFKNHSDVEISSGEQVRQYIYINDLIHGLWLIINNKIEEGVYNFPVSETLKVKDIVEQINIFFLNEGKIFINEKFRDLNMQNLKLKESNYFKDLKINKSFIVNNIYRYL